MSYRGVCSGEKEMLPRIDFWTRIDHPTYPVAGSRYEGASLLRSERNHRGH